MANEAGAGELKVGWASRDITPPRPCTLHGQFYTRVSEGTRDPLTVTALALESAGGPPRGDSSGGQGRQAIMVSCDLVGVWVHVQEKVREALRSRLRDFDTNLLFMAGTHIHTGPDLTEEEWYPPQPPPVMKPAETTDFFVAKVADAIEEAWLARKPGAVGRAYGQAVVGHNRRALYRDGSAKMYGKTRDEKFECFEGYEDHGLDLMCAWDDKGSLTGAVVNIACPSQLSEHEMKFTADFWHEARLELRRRLGEGLFVLPQCAPAGDQSPHLLIHKELEELMWKRRGVTQRQEVARRIAMGVEDALPLARADVQRQPVLRHVTRKLPLPVRMVTAEERDAGQAVIDRYEADPKADERIRHALGGRARRTVERFEEQKRAPQLPTEVHVVRVGDAVFATNPFECYLDYGLRIKARSAAAQTFCVQLACGYQGYLPTTRALRAGHYGAEVASNQVGPEGGQMLVDRTVEMIEEVWKE